MFKQFLLYCYHNSLSVRDSAITHPPTTHQCEYVAFVVLRNLIYNCKFIIVLSWISGAEGSHCTPGICGRTEEDKSCFRNGRRRKFPTAIHVQEDSIRRTDY